MLKLAGIDFQVLPSKVEEHPFPGEKPETYIKRAAATKAEAVARSLPPGTWVLAADTIVVVDGAILGKPTNEADAARMLELLSGRHHRVLTAVILLQTSKGIRSELLSETLVQFRRLDQQLIQGYLRTGEPLDKAGAYGIQGSGALLVSSIQGSYTNVVGLPLAETVQLIEEAGLCRPFADAGKKDNGGQAAVGGVL